MYGMSFCRPTYVSATSTAETCQAATPTRKTMEIESVKTSISLVQGKLLKST